MLSKHLQIFYIFIRINYKIMIHKNEIKLIKYKHANYISWKPSLAYYCVLKKIKTYLNNTIVKTQTFCLHLSTEKVPSTKLFIVCEGYNETDLPFSSSLCTIFAKYASTTCRNKSINGSSCHKKYVHQKLNFLTVIQEYRPDRSPI